jgi:hypothetical protein
MSEIARVSATSVPLVAVWWVVFLLSGMAGNYAGRTSMRADTLPEMLSASRVMQFSDGFDIVSAFLAAAVVWTITRGQEERRRLSAPPGGCTMPAA